MALKFEILKRSGKSRLGKLHTKHGVIDTPAFMPVGTCATVKAMMPESVAAAGAQILLGNTYHLMLRPGADLVEKMGGLHKFMNWDKPILTDSGGFQVMSLSGLRKLSEDGVAFSSHVDGKKFFLSPEESIKIQHKLDSNITMCLDECVKLPAAYETVKKSVEMSMRWAKRSKDAWVNREGYGIFGIQQGGDYRDLRAWSAERLKEIGFDGYAIGGLAVGEGQEKMFEVLDYAPGMLPDDKPRYLMGVGTPVNILEGIERGVDMFDCVMPTRNGRNGMLFTKNGIMNMRNKKWEDDYSPIEAEGASYVDTMYSRAYLRHLFHAQELLAMQIASIHNLAFYLWLAGEARKHIIAGDFSTWKPMMVKRLSTRL